MSIMISKTMKLFLLGAILCAMAACGKHEAPTTPNELPAALDVQELEASEVALSDIPEGGHCSLDAIDGGAVQGSAVTAGQIVVFSGWFGDASGEVPAGAKLMFTGVSGQHALPIIANVDRPDVAQALGQPGLARSGFDTSTRLAIEPGTYTMHILIGGASPVVCALDAELTVGNP